MDDDSGLAGRRETSSLLDAVLLISSDLDLRGALERLVRASCTLTGARYGFLGLLDENGEIADFVIHGLADEEIAAISSLPTGKGILGVLIEDPQPLRLDVLSDHERSVGFPANHPPMTTFLGVPVRVDGRVYGNLYLTEKAGGASFTESDEGLLEVLAQVAGFVIGNARTHAAAQQRHRWLEASVAMSDQLQDAARSAHALAGVAAHLRAVADALLVVVVRDADDGPVVVGVDRAASEAATGISVGELVDGMRAALATASTTSEAAIVGRVGGTTRLVVPVLSQVAPDHLLVVVLDDAALGVEGPDLDLFVAFAGQASLALDRTQALADRQDHVLIADRDRIARDLHDTVIQRLFATALQLQGLRRTVLLDEAKVRLGEAVSELNATIRDIRSTIFELRHDDGGSLKTEIRTLAKEYVQILGFTPFVRIRGPVDVAVPVEVAENLIATMREALSNVARHAEADACVVEVEVSQGRLLLRITDNGRGIDGEVAESGLRNMRDRAVEAGGGFRIGLEEPHGTLLEWHVPLEA
ncbi:GAF domain-containing protein [Nocardioides marmoriginsengisoli]|uniref:GAF domain-containing protein n=1 Tax=Nocardioides marmoriginsengisoli TaxID=661483 RepID=A0A3N0CRV2_9ACTN|nr:GAF domain-containing protein [Nocardioides marmoriginsengisoli]RNL66188.1 GAF domain-containing protein [Nocardioides marmoriginsengisoli]